MVEFGWIACFILIGAINGRCNLLTYKTLHWHYEVDGRLRRFVIAMRNDILFNALGLAVFVGGWIIDSAIVGFFGLIISLAIFVSSEMEWKEHMYLRSFG